MFTHATVTYIVTHAIRCFFSVLANTTVTYIVANTNIGFFSVLAETTVTYIVTEATVTYIVTEAIMPKIPQKKLCNVSSLTFGKVWNGPRLTFCETAVVCICYGFGLNVTFYLLSKVGRSESLCILQSEFAICPNDASGIFTSNGC